MAIELADDRPRLDVIVIGGGVNGSGVARASARRGLEVAVFERNDVAFGASGNSSGMIHGGPRYLVYDPDVTYTSCLDSGHIQEIAPHLLFRIPFLVPIQRAFYPAWVAVTGYDSVLSLYDAYQPLKHGKPHVRLTTDEMRRLEPGLLADAVGGMSFDEWGIDGARLCIGNIVDAMERGATARVHTTVTEILRGEGGKAIGVRWRDLLTGEVGETRAKIVVNATGAWAPLTATLAGLEPKAARVRPGKGIHVFLDRRLTNYAVVATAIDGRQVFLLPWQNMSVLGTTDDDYYGDLDEVVANGDEVRYLTQAVARVFPAVLHARAIGTWGGVRPTLYAWGKNEDSLSRDHKIVDHAEHGIENLFSMIGGKLASYRIFAEEMSDVIAKKLGNTTPCRTHVSKLPGGDESIDPSVLERGGLVAPMTAVRLEYRHGSRALRVLERMQREPREASVVCECEPVTEAEIRYVVEHELAASVDDVSRRTRLGLGSCGGMRCAGRCGQIVAQARGRSPEDGRRDALSFLAGAAKRRVAAVGPEQARQEALAIAVLRAQLGGRSEEQA